VVVVATEEGVKDLFKIPAAVQFVCDAYNHLKFIGYSGEAVFPLFAKAGIRKEEMDEGCIDLKDKSHVHAFLEACKELRYWKRGTQFLPALSQV
jgi:catalase